MTYADVTTDYEEALARIAAVLNKMQAQKRAPLQLAAAAKVPQTQAVLPLRDVFYRAKKRYLWQRLQAKSAASR